MPQPDSNGKATNWLLLLFASVLMALLGITASAIADGRKDNSRQDLEIALVQRQVASDSVTIRSILAKVDSLLHPPVVR